MSKILGIDTGGTFTDGVILSRSTGSILNKTKTPTTHHDLAICIQSCINNFPLADLADISSVCISTTLATNALVEGHGSREGLFFIGGIPDGTIPSSHIASIAGKIDIMGRITEPLDQVQLDQAIEHFRGTIQSAAVSGYASVRNPIFEQIVRARIQEKLNIPVVCAHELSEGLGYYERSVTAALNAKLIPLICQLLDAVESTLSQRNIHVPIMVVCGDGTLITAEQARLRPIETILSGPAASIAGARFLSGENDTLVLDIGGTTSDFANLNQGLPRIRQDGAIVGGWFTRVKAAEIYTAGFGGDSRIYIDPSGDLYIGPERSIPFCIAASTFPHLLDELHSLSAQLRSSLQNEMEAYILLAPFTPENQLQENLQFTLQDGPHLLSTILSAIPNAIHGLNTLVNQGDIARISLTPTDLLQIKGLYTPGDALASKRVISQFAERLGLSFEDTVKKILHTIDTKLSSHCLEASLFFDDQFTALTPSQKSILSSCISAQNKQGILSITPKLTKKIVAVGAASHVWAKALRQTMHTEVIVPIHAEVACAVGAAVSQHLESCTAAIRLDPVTKRYTAYTPVRCCQFGTLDEATDFAVHTAKTFVANRLSRSDYAFDTDISDTVIFHTFIERRIQITAVVTPTEE